jgi:hypothetical protein
MGLLFKPPKKTGRRVAHPFKLASPLVHPSAPAINPLGQLILQLTCLGPAFDLAGAALFASFAKGAGFDVALRPNTPPPKRPVYAIAPKLVARPVEFWRVAHPSI